MIIESQVYQPFIETNYNVQADELVNKLQENSYVFIRGLVPVELVQNVRKAILQICMEAGWLDPNYDLMQGVIRPDIQPTQEGKPDYAAVYRKVLSVEAFQQLPNHPNLLKIAGMLLGGEGSNNPENLLVHPRRIGRITFPHNVGSTTPPHQDFFHVRGSVNTYSCWIPLGDCPVNLGGLAVLGGSHRGGFIERVVDFPGATGGSGLPYEKTQGTWYTTDFKMGDALFFHSYTIHKALPNLSINQLRLSTDNRYQLKYDKIDPDALMPHKIAS
jgi:hypothetical protein